MARDRLTPPLRNSPALRKTQAEREQALSQFKSGTAPVLVATEVAARGLDILNVSLVVVYDFPPELLQVRASPFLRHFFFPTWREICSGIRVESSQGNESFC